MKNIVVGWDGNIEIGLSEKMILYWVIRKKLNGEVKRVWIYGFDY